MENLLSLAISSDSFELEKDGLRAGCDFEERGFLLHRRKVVYLHVFWCSSQWKIKRVR